MGSEMCIRDRAFILLRRVDAVALRQQACDAKAFILLRRVDAVALRQQASDAKAFILLRRVDAVALRLQACDAKAFIFCDLFLTRLTPTNACGVQHCTVELCCRRTRRS